MQRTHTFRSPLRRGTLERMTAEDDPPRSTASPRRRWRILLVAILAALALAVGFVITAFTLTAAAATELDDAIVRGLTSVERAQTVVAAAEPLLNDAESILDESAKSVLDESPRTALADAIDAVREHHTTALETLDIARSTIAAAEDVDGSLLTLGIPLRSASAAIDSLNLRAAEVFAASVATLEQPKTATQDAVAAWEEEQARILAARYTSHVWTSGWVAELDACQGAVDLTAHYGIPAIAEHWSCGGKDFPTEPGTIITLTGVHEGTYRVDGIVMMLDQSVATTDDLPHGFELVYQTCQNGQPATMSLTALTRLE